MAYSVIEIKNFRGIKHLTINGLGDVNIFTGRNNTGKSSCLEAIALLASGSSNFKNIFKEEMLEFIVMRRTKKELAWDYLINHGAEKASISGFYNVKNKSSDNILIGKSLEDLQLSPHEVLVESLREQFRETYSREREMRYRRVGIEKGPKTSNSLYFYYTNAIECLARIFQTDEEVKVLTSTIRKQQPKVEKKEVLFIGNFEQIGGELHDIIAEKGLIHGVIERLHEKFPDITDIRTIRKILYIFYGKEKMPLDIMGDGFKVNMLITLSGHAISNGILILEEPENFLHPGLMIHLVQELTIACKKQNIQIFLSTHSDEFIKFFIQSAKGINISIIKLTKNNNEVEAEVFDKAESTELLEDVGIDLRGF